LFRLQALFLAGQAAVRLIFRKDHMEKIIIDENRKSFKGNFHLHTTVSDGKRTPEEAYCEYREHGYDFIAVTDHWRVGKEANYKGMLVMPGSEFDWVLGNQTLHMLVLPQRAEDIIDMHHNQIDYPEVIERVTALGGICVAAHPAWSLNTLDFLLSLDGIFLSEVYNSVSDLPTGPCRAYSDFILDVAGANGKLFGFLANDDSHYYVGEQCRAFNMVQAEDLTVPAILEALRRGSFYASQGPLFKDVRITDGKLSVKTSEVCQCAFVSNRFSAPNRCRAGKNMIENTCEILPDDKFIRCVVKDEAGHFAWTSPIDLRV